MKEFSPIREFMDSLSDRYGVKGASVSVALRGEEVFRYHTGTMDDKGERPMEDDAIFRLFSMSKPVTVTAALQLLEQGKYLLSDPVGMYLPEFWNLKVWRIKPNGQYDWEPTPARSPMRVIDLFTMTAGLSYGGDHSLPERETSKAYDALIKESEGKYTTRDFARMIAGVPLLFDPGTHWNYSYCLDVLGALIEVWSGERLGTYLKNHIFDPLGMKDTAFRLTEEQKSRRAVTWYVNEKGQDVTFNSEEQAPFFQHENFEGGGAGLSGTLSDYQKFATALTMGRHDGKKILLAPETIELMRTNQLSKESLVDYDWEPLKGYGYGLGVRTLLDPALAGTGAPKGEFGWNGLCGTYVLMDPDRGLSAVFMQSRMPNHEGEIQPRLRNILYSIGELT